ncbi:MAG TPA: ABC transporter permease [Gemmatimonadaceae bacterium]|nr:ABC transporter permease [Gemmatimonadaceae bacterium]
MIRYLTGRFAQTVVVVLLVTTIAFFLIHAPPGDPFGVAMDNPNITEAVRAQWRAAYGLDRPLPEQFVRYIASVARGNLGWSYSHQRAVSSVLKEALPNTLLLMSVALAASFVLGIFLALVQALKPKSITDRVISGVSLFFFSMPEFWFAMMAMFLLAYRLQLFPISGMRDEVMYDSYGTIQRFTDVLRHLILPALTLTLLYSAVVARYQRAALLDTLPSDYIRTARAKGAKEHAILRRHALRNALLPTITLFGLAFPALLTGAVFVEKVFAWPGMGGIIVDSIGSRDYPLLVASVIVGSVLVALGSLIADLLYRVADPRLRDDY